MRPAVVVAPAPAPAAAEAAGAAEAEATAEVVAAGPLAVKAPQRRPQAAGLRLRRKQACPSWTWA